LYDIAPASYHHLLIFSCPEEVPPEWEDPMYTAPCPVIPDAKCFTYVLGWALGGSNLYFDIYGLPIGVGDGAPKFVLLQTHIDNPNSQTDIYEIGWGFRLFYTATLRPLEGGSFGFYSGTPLVGIPPKEEDFQVMSECNEKTTVVAFPEGIYVDSVFTHMHGAGRTSSLQIIRNFGGDRNTNWTQLPDIWSMTHYDSNWQGSRKLKIPGYRVEAGDKLRNRCSYNTMHKNEPTRNGEGYDDEMCIQYVNYYPLRSDLRPISICAEFPPGIGITFSDADSDLMFSVIGNYDYAPWQPAPDTCSVRK